MSMDSARICFRDPNANGQYFEVFANPGMTEKWRKNHLIPIDEVVQQSVVYFSTNQTRAPQLPSRQMLSNTFGTTDERDIINHILEKGEIRQQSARHHEKHYEQF